MHPQHERVMIEKQLHPLLLLSTKWWPLFQFIIEQTENKNGLLDKYTFRVED